MDDAIFGKPKGNRLQCAAYAIIILLAMNTLLLGTLVVGVVFVAVRAQPFVAAVTSEDVNHISAALRAVHETNLIENVGAVMKTVSNAHVLPSNLVETVNGLLGLDVGTFAKGVAGLTVPALKAVQTIKFSDPGEAQMFGSVANILNIGTAVSTILEPWKRANFAPNPDLGLLDAFLGSGEAGSGTSWILSQVNSTSLKKVSSSCVNVHTQLMMTDIPSISWKLFTTSSEDPSGKYSLKVDPESPIFTLVDTNTWSDIVGLVDHICSIVDNFANDLDVIKAKNADAVYVK